MEQVATEEELKRAKDYLSSGNRLYEVIRAKQEQLNLLEEVNQKTTKGKGKTGEAFRQAKEELQEDIIRNVKKSVEIMEVINSVENKEYSLLLILRYLNKKTWEAVSEEMGYSTIHVTRRLHPKALKEVNKILQNKNLS